MITATRRIQFCAGHRVLGHENKCAHLHGHNYVALVTARAPELDTLGRVIDFSVLKERVGGWIERHWDHGFIYASNDEEAKRAMAMMARQKVFALPLNPTAENMAKYLLHGVGPTVLGGTGVELVEVTIWETENCYATAVLPARRADGTWEVGHA